MNLEISNVWSNLWFRMKKESLPRWETDSEMDATGVAAHQSGVMKSKYAHLIPVSYLGKTDAFRPSIPLRCWKAWHLVQWYISKSSHKDRIGTFDFNDIRDCWCTVRVLTAHGKLKSSMLCNDIELEMTTINRVCMLVVSSMNSTTNSWLSTLPHIFFTIFLLLQYSKVKYKDMGRISDHQRPPLQWWPTHNQGGNFTDIQTGPSSGTARWMTLQVSLI